MTVLSCDDVAGRWHRRWHRNAISAIVECVLMGAPAVPLIGVTSELGGSGDISSLFLVFKTGVSSGPAQAGSIPVRLRYQRFRLLAFAQPLKDACLLAQFWSDPAIQRGKQVVRNRGDYWQVKVYAGRDPLTGRERYQYDRARPSARPSVSRRRSRPRWPRAATAAPRPGRSPTWWSAGTSGAREPVSHRPDASAGSVVS